MSVGTKQTRSSSFGRTSLSTSLSGPLEKPRQLSNGSSGGTKFSSTFGGTSGRTFDYLTPSNPGSEAERLMRMRKEKNAQLYSGAAGRPNGTGLGSSVSSLTRTGESFKAQAHSEALDIFEKRPPSAERRPPSAGRRAVVPGHSSKTPTPSSLGSFGSIKSSSGPITEELNIFESNVSSSLTSTGSLASAASLTRPRSELMKSGSGKMDSASSLSGTIPNISTAASSSSTSVGTHQKGPVKGLVGLNNLGNTCFMNSALQCLFNSPVLREYFSSGRYIDDINITAIPMKGALGKAFGSLSQEIMRGKNMSTISPQSFKREIGRFSNQFSGYNQQDSQEFLRFLMDGLNSDLCRIKGKLPYRELDDKGTEKEQADRAWSYHFERNQSIIADNFSGQLKSTVVCLHCKKTSLCFDPFMDISIPIPTAGSGRGGSSSSAAPKQATLEDCMKKFTEEEVLDGDEKYYCGACKTHQRSTKKLNLYRFPALLVIHLKRFSYSIFSRDKISTNVVFPIQGLDLTAFSCFQESPVFDLYGVVNHMGGLGGGHYTADVLMDDGQWYNFNDTHVSKTSPDRIGGSSAYLLFYKKREKSGG